MLPGGKKCILLGCLLSSLSACTTACHHSPPKTVPSIAMDSRYLDLQPGWRLRVVTPILESGGYKVRTEEMHSEGNTISLRTEKGFLGYQTDYYSVNMPDEGRLAVTFQHAEFTSIDQQKTEKPAPAVRLFIFPSDTRYVRLLFLTRVSETDHDEAVLAASSEAELKSLTDMVESNPTSNCQPQPAGRCSWIPGGVAVQVERKATGRRNDWIPVL